MATGTINAVVSRSELPVLREVPFAVAVSNWSGSGTFTANFTSAYITTTSKEIITYDSSLRDYAKADINVAKKSGGGGLTFTTTVKPTGTITGTAYVFASADGKVPVVIEDTVVSLANGGTGQSSLAGAQQVLGITALSNQIGELKFVKIGNIAGNTPKDITLSAYARILLIGMSTTDVYCLASCVTTSQGVASSQSYSKSSNITITPGTYKITISHTSSVNLYLYVLVLEGTISV